MIFTSEETYSWIKYELDTGIFISLLASTMREREFSDEDHGCVETLAILEAVDQVATWFRASNRAESPLHDELGQFDPAHGL